MEIRDFLRVKIEKKGWGDVRLQGDETGVAIPFQATHNGLDRSGGGNPPLSAIGRGAGLT